MAGVQVRFLGTGTPLGSGGRLQACILLEADGARLLLDCGLTSLVALARADVAPASIDTVAISHLHGDHVGGVALLLLDARINGPRRPLVVGGPAGTPERVRRGLEVFGWQAAWSPGAEFVTLRAGEAGNSGPFRITAFEVEHDPGTEPTGLRVEVGGRTIAYSGDAGWSAALPALAAGADVFICGVWSFDRPDPTFLDYQTLRAHRAELGCKRLVLTHLGPELLERRAELGEETADDGLTIQL